MISSLTNYRPSFNLLQLIITSLHTLVVHLSTSFMMARRGLAEEEIYRRIFAEDSDDDFDSGSSADEEVELEHQLEIFGSDLR